MRIYKCKCFETLRGAIQIVIITLLLRYGPLQRKKLFIDLTKQIIHLKFKKTTIHLDALMMYTLCMTFLIETRAPKYIPYSSALLEFIIAF